MTKKRQNLIAILGIISVSLITIGISISLFNYSKMGTSDNTITTGGLTFQYTEISGIGRGIAIQDAIPMSDELGKAQTGEGKVFNFKVSSTTTAKKTIPYTVSARMSKDSNLDPNVVKVYLTKVNGNNEEQVLLEKYGTLDQVSGVTGYTEKVIYTDTVPENSSNYNQEFNLRMWIADDTNYSNGDYNNKTFKITVNVNATGSVLAQNQNEDQTPNPNTLYGKIMSNPIVPDTPSLNTTATSDTPGLYASTETNNSKPTYYFRGAVENNYVDFAGFIWRVVRVNEDKSIRLVGTKGINNNNTTTNFNTTNPSNIESIYYSNSDAKLWLDAWYQDNIIDEDYDSYVLGGNYFCEQAKVAPYDSFKTVGDETLQVINNYTPNFKCEIDANGYGLVNSKIGLITVDELIYSGYYNSGMLSNGIFKTVQTPSWTMSPAGYASPNIFEWAISSSQISISPISTPFTLYPVINIKGDIVVSGDGSFETPYKPNYTQEKNDPVIKVNNNTLTKISGKAYDYAIDLTEKNAVFDVDPGFTIRAKVEIYKLSSLHPNTTKTKLSGNTTTINDGTNYYEVDIIDEQENTTTPLIVRIRYKDVETIKIDSVEPKKVDSQDYDYEFDTTENIVAIEVIPEFKNSTIEAYSLSSLDANATKTQISYTSVALASGISYYEIKITDDDENTVKDYKIKVNKSSTLVFKDAVLSHNNVINKNVNLKTEYSIERFNDHVGNGTGSYNLSSIGDKYLSVSDEYVFDEKSGYYSLVNPTTCKWSECYQSLIGKYWIETGISLDGSTVNARGNRLYKIVSSSSSYTTTSTTAAFKTERYSEIVACTENCSGLFKSNDTNSMDYTYYFRGDVVNNYVSFADKTWRIVRVNEDGTVRLVLNGTINSTSFKFSETDTSTSKYYSGSDIAKPTVDNWYNVNIDKEINGDTKKYSNYVETGNYFCEQERNASLSNSFYDYDATFKCSNGTHGLVNSNVGLLTMDELVYAGSYYGYPFTTYSNNYLRNGSSTWTMSTSNGTCIVNNERGSCIFVYEAAGSLANGALLTYNNYGLRPVINMKYNTHVKGYGTSSKPYTIVYD